MKTPKRYLSLQVVERALTPTAFENLLKKYVEVRKNGGGGLREPTENEKKALAFYLANDVSKAEVVRQYGLSHSSVIDRTACWVLKNQERV